MQQKNLNDHLAPPRMLLRTPKGCEHPWLGTPGLALTAVFDCVRLSGKQGIALRGDGDEKKQETFGI